MSGEIVNGTPKDMIDSLQDLAEEEPDGHTFRAICALLDRLHREKNPSYPKVLVEAQNLVRHIPPHECRLPSWNRTASGKDESTALAFWPILRSLGLEDDYFADWSIIPDLPSSQLPQELPCTLKELSISVDDIDAARQSIRQSELTSLVLYMGSVRDMIDLLESLPSSLEELSLQGIAFHQQISRTAVRKLTWTLPKMKDFLELLEHPPSTLVELGGKLFYGEGDRIAAISQRNAFSLQMERLVLPVGKPVTDRSAAHLASARFPRLVAFKFAMGQPGESIDEGIEVITEDGARQLAQSKWWARLESLSLWLVYCDEVLSPLLAALPPALRSLLISQESLSVNPHPDKVGFSDRSLVHLPLEVVASLDSLVLEDSQIQGAVLAHWASNWSDRPGRLKALTVRRSEALVDPEPLRIFLSCQMLRSVEAFELSWPSFELAEVFDLASSLAASPSLAKLKTLILCGWWFSAEQIISLCQDSAFAGSLKELNISCNNNSPQTRSAFEQLFNSKLGRGLRTLTITSISHLEPLFSALEECSSELNLRVLNISAKDISLISIERLTRSKALKRLWKLSIEGSVVSDEAADFDPSTVERVMTTLGSGEALPNLYELEFEDIQGFDYQAIKFLMDSPLVSRLLVVPDLANNLDIWSRSNSVSPFVKAVIDSALRSRNEGSPET